MIDPKTGAEIQDPKSTPGSATPPAQGGATGSAPAEGQHKQVPIAVMHEERDKRQAAEAALSQLRSEIDALKAQQQSYNQAPPQTFQPQYQQPYQPQYQQPMAYPTPPPNIKEQIDALWDQDIRKGFQAEMQAMMQYRDYVDTKIDNEFDSAKSRHPDFGNYESKIRSYTRSLPVDARSQDNIVEAAYLMVKGQDTDNILKAREAELIKKYQSQYGATGLGGTFNMPNPSSGQQTITPEERVAAQAMGLSDEDYVKYRGNV